MANTIFLLVQRGSEGGGGGGGQKNQIKYNHINFVHHYVYMAFI